MSTYNIISKMTLGTVQLGMAYGISNNEGKPDETKAFKIIESALANGVNCFDTAAAYGDSEKIIGNYFRSSETKTQDVTIVTKFKLGQVKSSHVEAAIRRSVEQSVKNLNTGWIDILLAHDAKEFLQYPATMIKVFEKLLYEGVIKMAGASCYDLADIEPMIDNKIFQAFQLPVNVLDLRMTKLAQRLRDKLVFARSIFLQGLFFMDPPQLKGKLREAGKYINVLKNTAAEMQLSVSELAVRYVLSLGYVDSLVIGAVNPEQVIENAELVKSKPFSQDVLDEIESKFRNVPDWILKPYLWNKQK